MLPAYKLEGGVEKCVNWCLRHGGWGGGGVSEYAEQSWGGGGGFLGEENERGQLMMRYKETCGLFKVHEKCKYLKG